MSLYKSIDFAIWSSIHRLPRFFVEYYQLRELKRVVRWAYERIPLYQKLFKEHGVSLDNIKTLDDIRRLPITSKQLFRRFPIEEVMDVSFPPVYLAWRETSGSTGEPFRFPSSTHHHLSTRFGRAYMTRNGLHLTLFLEWRGILSKHAVESMKLAEIRVHNQPRFRQFLHIPVSDLREDPLGVVRKMKEFAPDILNSRATVLIEFARLCAKFPQEERPLIGNVVSHGEMLTVVQREYIKNILGVEPYNRYGLEEVGSVAIDCEKHEGLHIHEESFIAEILDEVGNPLPDGKTGRVVLTFFNNYVMPFIRYDTGDQGFIISEPCECGIRARRIFVDGRRGGFISVGTQRFNNVEFEVFLSNFSENILRYQLAKVGVGKIELRVIPEKEFPVAERDRLQNLFCQQFWFKPDIKVVNEISYTKDGKTRFIIDETQ